MITNLGIIVYKSYGKLIIRSLVIKRVNQEQLGGLYESPTGEHL